MVTVKGQLTTTDLVAAKAGRTVSVCIPARDEASTVAGVVEVATALTPLVDEVIVVDDGSSDDTAAVAAAAGARVVLGDGRGKGRAMWRAVEAAGTDVIVFCDADLIGFGT